MIGTDGNNILHIPLAKHYNDLLERQSSERGKDEVSYFYVEDVFNREQLIAGAVLGEVFLFFFAIISQH